MKIFLGCDHAAFTEKEELKNFLESSEIAVEDCGTYSSERCNYPDFARAVSERVARDEGLGILICGSGIGVSMVANRFQNVRAALCRTKQDAELSRQHNNANVICLGARVTSLDDIKDITMTWLNTDFEGGRHSERIELFNLLGEK